MMKNALELLDVVQQQELVEKYGGFIYTRVLGDYIYDVYLYDTFYVVFNCPVGGLGEPKSKFFNTTDFVESFIQSISDAGA